MEQTRATTINSVGSAVCIPVQRMIKKQRRIFVIDQSNETPAFLVGMNDECSIGSVDAIMARMRHDDLGCVIVDCDKLSVPLSGIVNQLWRKMIAFPVIALTNNSSPGILQSVVEAGVIDLVTKPFDSWQLESAIQHAIDRDTIGTRTASQLRLYLAELTSREREVLKQCMGGLPAKVIASQLGITFQTVDKHRARALKKLRVGSLLELAHLIAGFCHNSSLNYI